MRYGPEGFGVFSGTGTTVNNIFVNNFFVTGLNELTSYDFYIQSICTGNTSNWIGPFSATTLNVINSTIPKVNIYPNPNNKIFNVQSSSNLESIDILDVIGRPVKTINIQKSLVNVNIENEPSGVYLLKLNFKDGVSVSKRIICN